MTLDILAALRPLVQRAMAQPQADAQQRALSVGLLMEPALGGNARSIAAMNRGRNQAGMLIPGNIDLFHRPVLSFPDGTKSTTNAMMAQSADTGQTTIFPTIVGGRPLDQFAAYRNWRDTGQNLGTFRDLASAIRYRQALNSAQESYYQPRLDASQPAPKPMLAGGATRRY